jgi:hypothetical protein
MRKQREWAVLLALALCVGAARAADGELSLGAGLHYSTGTYGTSTRTDIVSIPLLARYDTGPWTFRLTVPYLIIDGPSNVIPGLGDVNNKGTTRGRGRGGVNEQVSGLGDTVGSATYTAYYDRSSMLGLDLTGRVKLPTGDEDKGLGTGSIDESVQADLYKTWDRVTLFGDVGYTFFGHSDVYQLQNAANYGVGFSTKMNATDSVGLSLDARQAVTPGGPPQRELTAFWNRHVEKQGRLQAYVLFGLANGSPDWGVGISAGRVF